MEIDLALFVKKTINKIIEIEERIPYLETSYISMIQIDLEDGSSVCIENNDDLKYIREAIINSLKKELDSQKKALSKL